MSLQKKQESVSHEIAFECVSSQAMVVEQQDTWVLCQATDLVRGNSSVHAQRKTNYISQIKYSESQKATWRTI